MKVGVLTSSRADYSIYLPLLKLLKNDNFFDLKIIAFGTHLSEKHGYTVNNIVEDGFWVSHKIETLIDGDSPEAISEMIGKTIISFSKIWIAEKFDLIVCLGDRFEMFAAISSTVPFNIRVAHIHGGETTTGAIDNVFRHSISLMSKIHFVAAENYKNKLINLLGSSENIYNVGALSIDNLKNLTLFSKQEFKSKYNIDLNLPTILSTFHPETVDFKKNDYYANEYVKALSKLSNYQIIITMPNADTYGNIIREKINHFACGKENVKIIESFGTIGYLTCMKYARMLIGNTSSGFYDASFFPKWVINLGNRQNGRIITPNIINCEINAEQILKTVNYIEINNISNINCNIYGSGNAAKSIVEILKKKINELR